MLITAATIFNSDGGAVLWTRIELIPSDKSGQGKGRDKFF